MNSLFLPLFLIQLGCTTPQLSLPVPVTPLDRVTFAKRAMSCWERHMESKYRGFCIKSLERHFREDDLGKWIHYNVICGWPEKQETPTGRWRGAPRVPKEWTW